jgi:hypothetical protein
MIRLWPTASEVIEWPPAILIGDSAADEIADDVYRAMTQLSAEAMSRFATDKESSTATVYRDQR